MAKGKTKTKVEANNENQMAEIVENNENEIEKESENSASSDAFYHVFNFAFPTIEKAIVFSALISREVVNLLVEPGGELELEINTSIAPKGSTWTKHELRNFLKKDLKLEANVHIRMKGIVLSHISDYLYSRLKRFAKRQSELFEYLDRFNNVFGGNLDFILDVMGHIHCQEFRRDFLEQKIISGFFKIDENKFASAGINFILPPESITKDTVFMDVYDFNAQKSHPPIKIKEYSTIYDSFNEIYDFMPRVCYTVKYL